jgi:predicted deacetylase
MNTTTASIPQPARYLLRFDDLCPTVSRERWRLCRALVREFRIQPILAVVPDNGDPGLRVSPEDEAFWHELRAMESAGATIGLHGYRHLRGSQGRGFLPLQQSSEFAGVPSHWQRTWIGEGLFILREHGLTPRIWVAPQHGFDGNTLRALKAEGIHLLSDGLARIPFLRGGLAWIPQQLWAPQEKAEGLWTICIHPNTASRAQIEALRVFLTRHAPQFTSLDSVMAEFPLEKLDLAEQAYAELALRRILVRRIRKRFADRWRKRSAS